MEAAEKLIAAHRTNCSSGDGSTRECSCEKCISLNLASLDLTSVPDLSKVWQGLQKLYLDYNELVCLPQEIFTTLTNLKVLSFIGNDICRLPENIGVAQCLEELYGNENQLKELPKSFADLGELRLLNLVGNKLCCLPGNFENVKKLEQFYADDNALTELPDAFGLLSHLQVLDLEGNDINVLPRSFGRLGALKVLNLASNKLSQFPENFGDLESLENLDLSSNSLSELPKHMKCSNCLKKLYVDNNVVGFLPDWIGQLPALEEMGFKNNQLKNEVIPQSFGTTSAKLKFLHFGGNFITTLPETISELKQLETIHFGSVIDELERRNFQNGNWLWQIPESFGNMTNLKSINLEENQIREIPESFGQLVNLDFLDLGQNQLHEIPKSFGKLRSLRVCQLSKNHIELLPSDFGDLSNLEELRLDHNLIAELPESFSRLTKLKSLDVFNNCLSEFPECLRSLKNLVRLDLDRNNLQLHYMNVPQLLVQSKYAPRDPDLKDNWRGRSRQDMVNIPITKVEAVEGDGAAQEEEVVEYNHSFLKHAMMHNMSIWRSHSGSATRETSTKYGNSMMATAGHRGGRHRISRSYLDNSYSNDESDEMTSECSEDYLPSSTPSVTSVTETPFEPSENWDEEVDDSVPIDVENPYDTKPPCHQEELFVPGPEEYNYVGCEHIFLPSELHEPRVKRRSSKPYYSHDSQFENPDGSRIPDERTPAKRRDSTDGVIRRRSGYSGEDVEGQFDDDFEDSEDVSGLNEVLNGLHVDGKVCEEVSGKSLS